MRSEERRQRNGKGAKESLIVVAPGLAHTRAHHPESHLRMTTLMQSLKQSRVLDELTPVSPLKATMNQLRRVHTADLIEHIHTVSQRGGGVLDHGDTYATADSYELARLAAGGCCAAIDRIMTGRARNGIALVRPPGHHAESNRVSGFCLFNNVAIAARHAQAEYGIERVMILDFDVHHGNGTQEIFYYDDSVLFVSMHLYAPYFYPGIGHLKEMGTGIGHGYTLNVPFPPGVGDEGYCRILHEVVRPKATVFRPQMILISAGFDAHWQDPLASAGLSLTGYARIVRFLVQMAEDLCDGRILFVLEGGYHYEALSFGVLNTMYALLGKDEIVDELGPLPHPENDIGVLLDQLKRRHLPS